MSKSSSLPAEFVNLIIQLLQSPASSASIERVFSNFSFVHSKLRNRLGVERAAKLVFCYRSLRGCKEADYWPATTKSTKKIKKDNLNMLLKFL